MSLNALMQSIDDWCGTPSPGHPPRPPWLRDTGRPWFSPRCRPTSAPTPSGDSLYEAARDLYTSAAQQVALNPQPLPPLSERNP